MNNPLLVILGWALVAAAMLLGWFAAPPLDGRSIVAVLCATLGVLFITDGRGPRGA